MITTEQLGLISCHQCQEPFNDNDIVFTIAARRFSNYDMTFEEIMVRDPNLIEVPKEINFHDKCFEEVAGKDFTP